MAPKSLKKMQDEALCKKIAKERAPKDVPSTSKSESKESSRSEVEYSSSWDKDQHLPQTTKPNTRQRGHPPLY